MYEIYHAYTNTADLLFATLPELPVAMQQSFVLRRSVPVNYKPKHKRISDLEQVHTRANKIREKTW